MCVCVCVCVCVCLCNIMISSICLTCTTRSIISIPKIFLIAYRDDFYEILGVIQALPGLIHMAAADLFMIYERPNHHIKFMIYERPNHHINDICVT